LWCYDSSAAHKFSTLAALRDVLTNMLEMFSHRIVGKTAIPIPDRFENCAVICLSLLASVRRHGEDFDLIPFGRLPHL